MTLREFLKAVEGATDAVLDKPMRIKFTVYDKSTPGKDGHSVVYTPEVTGCGTNSQNSFIGPLGVLSQEELTAAVMDGEDIEQYDLYIPKDQLLLQIPDQDKPDSANETPTRDAVPHMRVEKE